jgi:cysteine desulfurase
MWNQLKHQLEGVILNGHPEDRIPNNLNISFTGVENKALVKNLQPDLAVSAGSACTTGSGKVEASHVLKAITDDEDRWHNAIRFGIGKDNTRQEIEFAIDEVIKAVQMLRSLTF